MFEAYIDYNIFEIKVLDHSIETYYLIVKQFLLWSMIYEISYVSRRSIVRQKVYTCRDMSDKCDITTNGGFCRSCRYNKCLSEGMKQEGKQYL